ncbi:MAG: hypothetical protein K1X35_05150 [Caulobacteraceae bacterium]|nr:hypothetical protein [Caulobacteraceae bacterium]
MKALRNLIVVAILAYAAWIAVPGVQTFVTRYLAPADAGPPPPEAAAEALAPAVEAAPQAEATATAVAEGSAPKIGLWIAAVGFYVASALLLANGQAKAFVAYMLGFAADLVLMMLNRPDMEILARSALPDGGMPDLKWIVLAGLALVGVGVLAMAGRGGASRREHYA